ncbi:MAG TPA: helix-turn-helix domain-containing protein [Bacteroidales bacterium]|nr:helix-turn-helix domain-containing protein [Bacteroidales bacterium]
MIIFLSYNLSARVLRIHFKTALTWRKEGKIASFKIGNRRYFLPEEILALKRLYF